MATSNITLEICGRRFSVSCAPGEESHVEMLGLAIDRRARKAGAAAQGESRMLLFAALMLADELHETQSGGMPDPDIQRQAELAERVEAITARIEKLAAALESAAADA